MYTFFTDNGPDYSCSKCGANTLGEIEHECGEIVLQEKKCSHCKVLSGTFKVENVAITNCTLTDKDDK